MEFSYINALCFYFEKLKTELKNHGSLNIVCRFLLKNADFSKIMGTWQLIGTFFQKLSWCSSIVVTFMFLVYPYPEIWTACKNDPHPQRPNKTRQSPGLIGLTDTSILKALQGIFSVNARAIYTYIESYWNRAAGEGKTISFRPLYHFLPLHRHLRH